MTRKARIRLKRMLAQGYHHLEISQDRLGALWNEFNSIEPQYGEFLKTIGISIEQSKVAILEFAKFAWNMSESQLKNFES